MKKVIVEFEVDTEDPKVALTLVSVALSSYHQAWDGRINRRFMIFMEPLRQARGQRQGE
jgi:hypothetical protein